MKECHSKIFKILRMIPASLNTQLHQVVQHHYNQFTNKFIFI